jgi:hypothetical protein
MKLIREDINDAQFLEEGTGDQKNLFIKGIFLQAGIKNRNGRIYPPPILEREVNNYTNKYIITKKALGELSHPNTPSINLDKACILVTECTRDGNNWVGKAKVLDTPHGKTLQALIKGGYVPGVSSRGVGTLKEDSKLGAKVVQDDYKLMVMIDVVHDQSAPDAVVQAVMENVEWVYNAVTGEWQQQMIEDLGKDLKTKSSRELQEQKILAWHRFMRILAGK